VNRNTQEGNGTSQKSKQQGLCVLKKRARQDLQSRFGMNTVVAHASRNGRKTSMAEQADDAIAQSRHDFRSIVFVNGTLIFSQSHIFDVMADLALVPTCSASLPALDHPDLLPLNNSRSLLYTSSASSFLTDRSFSKISSYQRRRVLSSFQSFLERISPVPAELTHSGRIVPSDTMKV
jgi:hypothetical protein